MPQPLLSLRLVVLLMLGCGITSPATRAWEEAEWDDTAECTNPDADECIEFACDGEEGQCGVFSCEDVDQEALTSASLSHGAELARAGAHRPPMRRPPPFRNWRNMGVREGARPRVTFHFRYRLGYLPAFPRYEGPVVRHHLFPQAPEFGAWFRRAGINIHEWTMLIPEHIHRQIHSGAGRGGLWNAAWRAFKDANPEPPSRDVMIRHAFELAFRYELTGPIVQYKRPVVPIGPQLYQN